MPSPKHLTHLKHLKDKPKTDEYITPDYAVKPILAYIKPSMRVWCPFDHEDSPFVRLLRENGNEVIHSHIEDGKDFFLCEPDSYDIIVSNPPFSKRMWVINRCYTLNKPFMLLMNMTGIFDNRKRFETFKESGVQLLVPQGRVTYLSQSGEKTQSPMFQSVYVCRDILPHDIEFAAMPKESR